MVINDPDATILGRAPGLPDDAYDHDGLVTKQPIRASALALLRPLPGQTLWDIGAGAGSVVIEWCRTDPTCRGLTVERREERAARCRGNVARLTRPGQVRLDHGEALDAIRVWRAEGERPDAVFIGGGGDAAVIQACWDVLPAGGRLVMHGVTLEGEQAMIAGWRARGGELARLGVEKLDAIGRLHGWAPTRTIMSWAVTKHPGH